MLYQHHLLAAQNTLARRALSVGQQRFQGLHRARSSRRFSTSLLVMAPTPVPLPRHICDALGLGKDEAAFREGSATIVLPSKEAAFLNPVQEFNRDLSVLAIRTWGSLINEEKRSRFDRAQAKKGKKASRKRVAETASINGTQLASTDEKSDAKRPRLDETRSAHDGAMDITAGEEQAENGIKLSRFRDYRFTILEALSATGLRSIRYAREIPQLRYVLANDLSSTAVDAMKRNIALNFPAGKNIEAWVPLDSREADAEKGGMDSAAPLDNAMGKTTLDETVIADLESAVKSSGEAVKAAECHANTSNNGGPTEPVAEKTNKGPPTIHADCKVRLNEGDAITLMYTHREERQRFDVVDLDPYGSAAMFLDAAVQSVSDGGLLCVTCTDSAVLAGTSYPEKAFSAYGGVTTKSEYSHEFGLRLVLHAISASAARYGRYIEPMLCLSIDFYVRLFVRVWTRPAEVKRLASHTGCVFTCSSCQLASALPFGRHQTHEARPGQEYDKFQAGLGPNVGTHCHECGGRFHTAGPMWLGKLHNADFCNRMLETLEDDNERKRFGTAARIRGMVGNAADELPGDKAPFYFTPSKVGNFFHTQSPPLATVVSALLHAGFEVSRAHAVPGSLKTTAPRETLYDFYRAWVERNPVKFENVSASSPTYALLTGKTRATEEQAGVEKEPIQLLKPKLSWNLDQEHPQAKLILEGSRSAKGTKYQVNPLPNWGPGTAAKSTPRARA